MSPQQEPGEKNPNQQSDPNKRRDDQGKPGSNRQGFGDFERREAPGRSPGSPQPGSNPANPQQRSGTDRAQNPQGGRTDKNDESGSRGL